eukprot:1160624-Pelagomonas_calceolata.AAC.15
MNSRQQETYTLLQFQALNSLDRLLSNPLVAGSRWHAPCCAPLAFQVGSKKERKHAPCCTSSKHLSSGHQYMSQRRRSCKHRYAKTDRQASMSTCAPLEALSAWKQHKWQTSCGDDATTGINPHDCESMSHMTKLLSSGTCWGKATQAFSLKSACVAPVRQHERTTITNMLHMIGAEEHGLQVQARMQADMMTTQK